MLRIFFVVKASCLICFGAADLTVCGIPPQQQTINKIDKTTQCQMIDTQNIYAQLQNALKSHNKRNIAILLKAIEHIPFNRGDHTILHDAIHYGSKTVLLALLEKEGIRVNNRNIDGFTPLHLAVRQNKISMIKLLLQDTRIKINKKSKSDLSAIDYAISMGYVPIVSVLLQDNRMRVHKKSERGCTLLHTCILQAHASTYHDNYLEIIKLMLKISGMLIDLTNNYGETPLHYACLIGNSIVIQLLLNYGANINATNYRNQTPAQLIKHMPHCIHILQNAGSD